MQITIDMTVEDFDQLCSNGGEWGGWAEIQSDRWSHATKKYDTPPSFKWKYFYTLPNRWSDVMFARSFLEAEGADFELIYEDQGGFLLPTGYHDRQYIILTNYAARGYRDRKE